MPSWAAWADASIPANTLGTYSAQITVPSAPIRNDNEYKKIAIFTSISQSDWLEGIFQGVIGHRWRDDTSQPDPGLVYTLSFWDLASPHDYLHTPQITGINPGDKIASTIWWQDGTWQGEIHKLNDPTISRSLSAKKFAATDVCIDAVLEGDFCVNEETLPGNVHIDQIAVTDRGGKAVTPAFSGWVNRRETGPIKCWNTKDYPNLDVMIRNANEITIITGRV